MWSRETKMSFTTDEDVTLNTRLQKLAEEKPEKPAYVILDKHLKRTVISRQDVWDKSRKCAAFLRRIGIVKGDVVCNTLVNCEERLITTFGTMLAGAVCMQGQTLLADGEDIIKNWKDSQCKAVIINTTQERGAGGILEKLKSTDKESGKVRYEGLPYLTHVIKITVGDNNTVTDECTSLSQLLDQEPEMYVDETVVADDVAVIWTTSGSTGFAKLIPQTHRRVVIIFSYLSKFIKFREDSIYFNQRSLGWVGGAPFAYPTVGLTRVIINVAMGTPEDKGSFVASALEQEKCDTALIMPSSMQAILDHFDSSGQCKLNTLLRCVGTGGGPISAQTMRAIGRITESLSAMYGASEFGITHAINVTDASEYESACVGYSADSDAVLTKIVDENMQELPPGVSGEILLQAPTVIPEYLNNSAVNKGIFLRDGWFYTSDIGHKDKNGLLFVYCRKSFAINYRGYIHYPGWMETKIDRHPDIKKCYAIGIPDPTDYEKICLCITTYPGSTLTSEEAHEYCKSLFLTSESSDITPVPKYYFFFESFPLNSNGKIDRKALKEMVLKRVEVE